MIISEFNYAGGGRAAVLCLWCCTSTSHTLLLNHIIIEYQLVNIMLMQRRYLDGRDLMFWVWLNGEGSQIFLLLKKRQETLDHKSGLP